MTSINTKNILIILIVLSLSIAAFFVCRKMYIIAETNGDHLTCYNIVPKSSGNEMSSALLSGNDKYTGRTESSKIHNRLERSLCNKFTKLAGRETHILFVNEDPEALVRKSITCSDEKLDFLADPRFAFWALSRNSQCISKLSPIERSVVELFGDKSSCEASRLAISKENKINIDNRICSSPAIMYGGDQVDGKRSSRIVSRYDYNDAGHGLVQRTFIMGSRGLDSVVILCILSDYREMDIFDPISTRSFVDACIQDLS